MIHRDLKPANLLLSSQGCLKIGDFGLSSTQRRVVAAGDSYVMTGRTGTIRYMAPEAMEVGHETACTGDGGNKNAHVYARARTRAHTHSNARTHNYKHALKDTPTGRWIATGIALTTKRSTATLRP